MVGIKSLYGLKNSPFSHCDLVVPLGYGLLNRDKLPDASEKTLQEAIRIVANHQTPIAWASANFFWSGCEEEENRIKLTKVHDARLTTVPIIAEGVFNSVTEAQNIRQAVIKAGIELQSKTIVVVADWAHARSARRIWRKVFPESTIIVLSIEGKWDKSNPVRFARSEFRWLLINVVRHLGLRIFGLRFVGLIHHPIRKATLD